MGPSDFRRENTTSLNSDGIKKLSVRAVVFCCDGSFQRQLISQVERHMALVGVVVQNEKATPPGARFGRLRRLIHPVRLLRHLLGRWAIHAEKAQAQDLLEQIEETSDLTRLQCPVHVVENINDPATVALLDELRPDVVLVNGTRLIRPPLLNRADALRLGMINLHTGLSPYSRGGNCNLHMLREGRPELVGATVHHIDPGIDSGDLILTGRPELKESDSFERIETKVFLLGIDLLIRAVDLLERGRAPRVPQWTDGKLFLRRTGYVYEPWQRFEVRELLRRGLVRNYLANRATRDANIRIVKEDHSACDAG